MRCRSRAAPPGRRANAGQRPVAADRGAGSLWLLAVGLLLLGVALTIAAAGAAQAARHRAQTAADLGGLAGAARAAEGEAVACARAAELVAANGGRLLDCRLAGFDLHVTAAVAPPAVLAGGRWATATARAGPLRAAPDHAQP